MAQKFFARQKGRPRDAAGRLLQSASLDPPGFFAWVSSNLANRLVPLFVRELAETDPAE